MKKCEFGHYYSDHLDACPYCSSESSSVIGSGSTTSGFIDGEATSGFLGEETVAPDLPNNFDVPTGNFNTGADDLPVFPMDNVGHSESGNADRTIIIEQEQSDDKEKQPIERPTRKLVGWLVSYTLDEMGYDYRLYEGKNVIGSKPGNEVSLIQDNSVSGVHATILYRNKKFLLRDEFSTNGTFLNNKIVEEETPILKDGDIIKVGNTIFMFKIAIF